MVCVVIGARKLGVNPDNIATPIAASLGDLITLSILAFVSSFFYKHRGRPTWVPPARPPAPLFPFGHHSHIYGVCCEVRNPPFILFSLKFIFIDI